MSERTYEFTVRTTGAGRWVYCKYCYRSVLPLVVDESLDGRRQVMVRCSRCDHGLDILYAENLPGSERANRENRPLS